jgi:hypothetical protein
MSGAVPATLTINGTVGAPLIDAVVRAHGSSHVSAQPLKAMPMGPVTAHISNATTISPLRHDISEIVSRTPNTSVQYAHALFGRCGTLGRDGITSGIKSRLTSAWPISLSALLRPACPRARPVGSAAGPSAAFSRRPNAARVSRTRHGIGAPWMGSLSRSPTSAPVGPPIHYGWKRSLNPIAFSDHAKRAQLDAKPRCSPPLFADRGSPETRMGRSHWRPLT